VSDLHRFINALRILANIDRWQLEEAGVKMDDAHWSRFTNSIDVWFMKASDEDAAKVWALVEAQQPRPTEAGWNARLAAEIAEHPHIATAIAERDAQIWEQATEAAAERVEAIGAYGYENLAADIRALQSPAAEARQPKEPT